MEQTSPDDLRYPNDSDSPDIPRDIKRLADDVQAALTGMRTVTHVPLTLVSPFISPDAARPVTLHHNSAVAHVTGIMSATSGFTVGGKTFVNLPVLPAYQVARFVLSINGGTTVGPRFVVETGTDGVCRVACYSDEVSLWTAETWITLDVAYLIAPV